MARRKSWILGVAALVLGAMVCAQAGTFAATPPPPPAPPALPPGGGDVKPAASTATIKALAVLASKEDKDFMDPALASLAQGLKRSAPTANSFRLLMQVPQAVPYGQTGLLPLVEGYLLRVQPVKSQGETIEMVLTMLQGSKEIVRTTIVLTKGKYMLLAGCQLKGGTLLTAVSAR